MRHAAAADRPAGADADPTRQLVALAIVLAWLVPARALASGPVLCPFRRATGLPCPACGLSRSWTAALTGHLAASVRFHPLGLPALALAGAYAARLDERAGGRVARSAWPALAAGWLAVWVARLGAEGRGRR